MPMPVKEVAKRFNNRWSDMYLYYWDSYIDISHPMRMYCPRHGDFKLTPISHYRSECCPECDTLMRIREGLDIGAMKLSEIAEEYGVSQNRVLEILETFG